MRRLLAGLIDVRRGEALLTLLMFAYYYVILVTYYLLKPARDSLFLVRLGSEQLPFVFIITALIIAPITTLYASAGRALRLTHLVYVTCGVLVVNLVALRFMLELDSAWVFYTFYVWVSIYGALTASQFWLFANAVYTPPQAKRLFPLLGLGGILGAMTGGEVTGLIVRTFGVATEDLLWICMALVVAMTLVVRAVWMAYERGTGDGPPRARASDRSDAGQPLTSMFRMIRRSRHLLYLVGIVALTMATASFVDYQFKTVSVREFPDKEGLTAFLGTFYGRLSLVSLVLQLFLTYRVVRWLGVGGLVMALPLMLVFGAAAMAIIPGLAAAVFLRGSQGALNYSFDKTGREMLFLPIPLEVKKRTKMFIDVFVDRWFRGVAGAILLLLTAVFGFTPRALSLVVLAMVAAWVVLATLARREYVNTFRQALARRELDPDELTVNISDAGTLGLLRELLHSENEREVVYALDVLSGVSDRSLVGDVDALIQHPSDEVRRRSLELLRRLGSEPASDRVDALLHDDDPEVRLAAVDLVADIEGGYDRVRSLLDDEPRVAATALRGLARRGEPDAGGVIVDGATIDRILGGGATSADEVRVEVARALGYLEPEVYGDRLKRLAADESLRVAGAAVQAMGVTRDSDYVPLLIDMLADSRLRKHARVALAEYGNSVVDTLARRLSDEETPASVRRNVPAVLAKIPTQQSADALSTRLGGLDVSLRFRVVRALNKLRKLYPGLHLPRDRVRSAFEEEARSYYTLLCASRLVAVDGGGAPEQLLSKALSERLEYNLERIFRLLGLAHAQQDIYNAYLGIVGEDRGRRASAVEFLDNVLDGDEKRSLLPIVDRISDADTVERGRELFEIRMVSRDEALVELITGPDPWLRACAVYYAGGAGVDAGADVRRAVAAALEDPDPVVGETARRVMAA